MCRTGWFLHSIQRFRCKTMPRKSIPQGKIHRLEGVLCRTGACRGVLTRVYIFPRDFGVSRGVGYTPQEKRGVNSAANRVLLRQRGVRQVCLGSPWTRQPKYRCTFFTSESVSSRKLSLCEPRPALLIKGELLGWGNQRMKGSRAVCSRGSRGSTSRYFQRVSGYLLRYSL